MRAKTKMLLAVLVMILTAGCATYNTQGAVPMMGRIPQNQLGVVEKDGLSISVYPVKTEEEAKRYFDDNLLDDGILAVYFVLANKTSNSFNIDALTLKTDEGVVVSSLALDLVYDAVKKDYVWRAGLWGAGTGMAGLTISLFHTRSVNKDVKADIRAKSIESSSKEIKPLDTVQGFSWFKLPDKIAEDKKGVNGLPKGMVLNLSLESAPEKKLVKYEIPISDLTD
ncbi:MAG: hypothetical protein PHT44_00530 [Candidatus Portnoybacteria bacterium]|nr:hypothetical protein [Candidatus Portnoybacteria bacterium]MDD4982900.1 hypothetical protein [Candidatus Portnoybacteria bacterium]